MVHLSKRGRLWVMITPALFLYGLFFVYPVVWSAYTSFTSFSGVGNGTFVGLSNYSALAHDQFFRWALRNTCIVLVESLLVLVPASFALALLMQCGVRGAGVLRALIFAPIIMAPILIGLIFVFILAPNIGLVTRLLGVAGVQNGPQWIGGTTLTP